MDGAIYRDLLGALREFTQVNFPLINNPEPVISPVTEEGVPIRKLFIGNLAERTTNKDLQKLFSKYGKVDSCYIKRNQRKSNFAFITFNDVDGGIKAREAASRMEIQLHCRILRVSSADSWHQPDSIENQKRFLQIKDKEINDNNKPEIVEKIVQENSPIQVLNDDCLIEIFLYLPIADRIRMERVCKRWQALSQESWRSVKRLDLARANWGLTPKIRLQNIDTSTLRKVLIKCGQFLTHLDLSKYPHVLGSSTLTIVGKFCPNLQSINIKALELSPSGIDSLMTNCQNISKFIMKSLTGPCEKDLSQLFMVNKKLQTVEIEDEHIIGKCLGHLPTDIEEIHMIFCTSVLSSYLDIALQRFTALKRLTLNSCVCLIDTSLKAIGGIETLTHLELGGNYPTLTANAMNHLANLINLQYLNVRNNIVVTDDFLINVSTNCKKLNCLDITGCAAITDRAIANLSSLPKLEALVISWATQITDEPLGNLPSLKVLKCWGCHLIKDRGIINLIKSAQNLKTLDCSRCSITNNTLEAAISITKKCKNNIVLKIIVGNTKVDVGQLSGVSPFLQIVNIDLSITLDDDYLRNNSNFINIFGNYDNI